MRFQVFDSGELAMATAQRARQPLGWPINELEVGQGFIVPITDGKDPDGRPFRDVYTYAHKASKRLGRKFSASRLQNGNIAITRLA